MIQAKNGDTVRILYTGKFEDGTEFAASLNDDPLQFTLGEGQVIPGLEQAVIGMHPGESKIAEIMAEQAYGLYQDSMVREIQRNQFPPQLNLQVGKVLTTRKANGDKVRHIVTSVSETNVTIDANHPLAGEDLIFEIELIEIEVVREEQPTG